MPLLPPLQSHNGLTAPESPYTVPPPGALLRSVYLGCTTMSSFWMPGDYFGDQGGIRGSEHNGYRPAL